MQNSSIQPGFHSAHFLQRMLTIPFILLLTIGMFFTACQSNHQTNDHEIREQIFTLMDQQEQAWNRGNIDAFMEGYLRSDSLRFASADQVRYGWKQLRERYKNTYPDAEAMGTLRFSERDLTVLNNRHAYLFGRWQLFRSRDTLSGRYTLVFRNTADGWRITHDHTSSK